MMPISDTRWRPRNGTPRTTLEVIAQWLWCWRRDLMLMYLVCCWTATIAWWVFH